jgi:uncharacterized membrane protein (UPF0127 family)
MTRSAPLLLAAALALVGCPSASDGTPPPPDATTTSAPDPSTASPTADAAPSSPIGPAGPSGPTGPAGPAGPSGETPGLEDGRDQLDLVAKVPIRVGDVPVTAYIADTEPRRELGLMHVTALPPDHGMLFVFPDVREHAFWMHNTRIGLSIAYIKEDGEIATILDMEPMTESTHPSGTAVRFALEMPKGWFRAHHVERGARVQGITSLPGYD